MRREKKASLNRKEREEREVLKVFLAFLVSLAVKMPAAGVLRQTARSQ